METIFTDVRYTPDGEALVLHATDGIYVARPVGATPQRVLDKTCSTSQTKSLDCVRYSKDARRLAVLVYESASKKSSLWDLAAPPIGVEGRYDARRADEDVLEATIGQDGNDVVYVKSVPSDGALDVFHLDAAGKRSEIVHRWPIGSQAPAAVARSLVVTPYGVAYPRGDGKTDVDARFRPWDREGFQLSMLPKQCVGPTFPYCVMTNADGTAVAWQDPTSGILHAYRPQADLDLPLGTGYGLSFSKGGSIVLRMDYQPYTAAVQRVDTAVVVREVVGAISGELSADGETLAWLTVESSVNGTWRLWLGASRREGQDRDLGVFGEPTAHPLLATSTGDAPLAHALTGDARFVLLDAPPDPVGPGARLVAVNAETAEVRTLDTLQCNGCCVAGPAGALVACIPTMSGGQIDRASPLDLYDPATGLKTRASEKAILVEPLADGSGAAVLEYQGEVPELFVAYKDGRRESKGLALRVAASPKKRQVAYVNALGRLQVDTLP